MPLWLDELLRDPGLGLELVAGHDGLTTRGPVRWAHISDTPDPTPWLEGGEILLTTGLGVKDSPELQRRQIAGLAARGCTAVGFGVGVILDDVPKDMLAAADDHALPLFTVPYEVPFIAVTRRVAHATFEEHYATLEGAVQLHRRVLAAVVGGAGLGGVLDVAGRQLPDHALVAFDVFGQVLARRDGGEALAGTELADLWELVAPANHPRDRVDIDWGERHVTSHVVRLGDQVDAVLAVVSEDRLLEHEQLFVEQALAGLSLELARGLSVREARRGRVDELLEEVATGHVSREILARQLDRLGAPAGAYRALCLSNFGAVPERSLAALCEDVLSVRAAPVLGRLDGATYALVPADADGADTIAAAVRERAWQGVTIGRSRVHRDADGLRTALREAWLAAGTPAARTGEVNDVTDLGVVGLLAGIPDDVGTDHFVEQVLGPVLGHERDESTPLIESLRAYLAHGCRPGPAADDLEVHRHTLAYRLDRIRDLTGRDPRDGEHLLAYSLALALLDRSGATG
jgi:purine catabolism regulator